jgi:predicted ATPase
MKRRVPGIAKVEAKPTEDGRLVLRFQDGAFKDPFIARYVSDGTIKMFAYLVPSRRMLALLGSSVETPFTE